MHESNGKAHGVAVTRQFARKFGALVFAVALLAALVPAGFAQQDTHPWNGPFEAPEGGPLPASSGKTELMEAAAAGDLGWAQLLLAESVDVDARNANGGTALMYAASAGECEVMGLLLRHGADPNARARIGWTPLLVAAAKGRGDAVHLLIESGADPAAQDAYGWTPLMRAVSGGYLQAVDALLASGASVIETREESGATALHIAAGLGFVDIVQRLLAAGAEPLAPDGAGRTPAEVARMQGHKAAEALLRI